jgi:hypothetical protein
MSDRNGNEIDLLSRRDRRPGLLGETVGFLKENKKWWLAPIVASILVLGVLVLLAGSAAAPFIYTLF